MIIGILSAIALPSFLNQANKAKQSEAKQYIGTLNRVQQSYYLEKSKFASNLTDLANPVPSTTENYAYTFATAATNVINTGKTDKAALKAYIGMVAISVVTASSDATTTAFLCEANTPGTATPTSPTAPGAGTTDRPACGSGTTPL
ncbi:pesticin [Nostoc sp. HG1]|nr:pesticin [Nostoc sp. HG1]